MDKRVIHRFFDLIAGVPLLLSGACAIAIDILSWIGAAQNQNPNHHAVATFPAGTVIGVPLFWFGCHFVFRTSGLLLVHRLIARLRRVTPPTPNTGAGAEPR